MRNGEPRFIAQRPWTDDETDRLADMIADGKSFQRAADHLGRTKNSCIGRWHNVIVQQLGAQAA